MRRHSSVPLSLLCLAPFAQNADTPRIASAMQEMVDAHEIRGSVTLVATRDRVTHLHATGYNGPSGTDPLKVDSIFWIASMTKPVTGIAIMMLQEEGKLSVNDPVSKYIPEFASLRTPSGKPADLTLKHLMTHTSGLGEFTAEDAKAAHNLRDLVPTYLDKLMQFEPGAKWRYCQSGLNALGHH